MTSNNVPKKSYSKTVFAIGVMVLAAMMWKAVPDGTAVPESGTDSHQPVLTGTR